MEASNMAIKLNEQSFSKEVLESNIPVLVAFWAPWCGPCQSMGPLVEEIGTELYNKVKVCELNVDDNPSIAADYDVMSIPMFAYFKNGKLVDKVIGAVSKDTLLHLVEQ